MPVAMTYLVVGFTIYDWWLGKQVDWVGLVGSGLLSLLLVARQGVLGGQFEMRQYAALVNASADMAFICQQDGVIRLANPALQKILAEEKRDLREAHLNELLGSQADLTLILDQACTGGWSGEVMLRRYDGDSFPVSLSLRPVHDARKGQILLAGNAHDLTEVRQREHALREALEEIARARTALEELNVELEGKVARRTEELENTIADLARLNEELKVLDRLKSEFVALVSHELRAPLTNISSGIELILEGGSKLSEPSHKALTLVQSETRRLSQFVETILDLSALEAGRFALDETELSLKAVADRVLERIPADLMGNRLSIQFAEHPPCVRADERALESVLFHLIDNALKYAPDGEVVVDAWEESGRVYAAIIDEGPGIPEDERDHIFDLFHRLDTRDAREVYGYGLGLPMVQRLLDAMCGGIKIEESDSGGARVVFWLPKAEEDLGSPE
jgi:PAS domain S-box-containing protein